MVKGTRRARDREYRRVIDELVRSCRGQGQVSGRRLRAGVWQKVTREKAPKWMGEVVEQWRAKDESRNQLLKTLSRAERRVLAGILAEQFQGGVHQALVILHENQVPPFDSAYEGTPFHDFIGRLNGWKWPKGSSRA